MPTPAALFRSALQAVSQLSPRLCALNVLGSAILAFGLYHIHNFAGVTEGGILGAVLLLQYWLGVSPAWSSLIINALCYLIGWRVLGRDFILYSIVAGGAFSLAYAVCELFPPLWPVRPSEAWA